MPSPFPGMNPYIEQPAVWEDFHTRFMTAAAEVIAAQVEPRYFVKIEERLFLHEPFAAGRDGYGRPDLSVLSGDERAAAPTGGTATAAPATVYAPEEEEASQRYLEVRDRQSRAVVTVVELLSPANKESKDGREQYWNKTRVLLNRTETNLVEIDLLRGGPRLPWRDMPACDYYALVCRTAERPRAAFWPVRLRESLPTIPIPLRPDEPEASLDLQALVHRIYDAARYKLFIYDTDPEPPLRAADAVWAALLLNPPAS